MAVSTQSFRAYISQLSGRRLGTFKSAAEKLGVTLDEYVRRVEAGQKNCIDCRSWKDRGDFAADSTRWDGVAAKCRACASSRGQSAYEPIPPEDMKCSGPARNAPRDGDKLQARHLVNLDVAKGRRPNPNDLHCAKCGHKGEDLRHEYHHHMGYGAEHAYDVVALCSACHHEEH